jgi:hypothetical protein
MYTSVFEKLHSYVSSVKRRTGQDSFKVMSSTLQYHSEAKLLIKQPW